MRSSTAASCAALDPLHCTLVTNDCLEVRQWRQEEIAARSADWQAAWEQSPCASLSRHPCWLLVLRRAMGQEPYLLEAKRGNQTLGLLPLALVASRLFGRFLVSLPYLNTAGVLLLERDGGEPPQPGAGAASDAPSTPIAAALLDRAAALADELDVRYLELRHERHFPHEKLTESLTSKVHMRLQLPATADELWHGFSPKVRNQIRKAESQSLSVEWGTAERLPEFYDVFSRNMRDLGTPVYPARLFAEILHAFPGQTELCVVRAGATPIAVGLLAHGRGVTEVPSASSLRAWNATNANMLMYWHLLQRAIERGQQTFDFGRSSAESNTYRFKKQWGATATPAVWQYYVRRGSVQSMRPDDARNRRLIRIWQKLPVWLTRKLGPLVVRGIP